METKAVGCSDEGCCLGHLGECVCVCKSTQCLFGQLDIIHD